MSNLNFGQALEALKQGKIISRAETTRLIYLTTEHTVSANKFTNTAQIAIQKRTYMEHGIQGSDRLINSHIDSINPWGQIECGYNVPLEDMLAEDWQIVE